MARKSEPRYITEQADFPSRLKSLMDEKAVTQKTLAEVIGMRPQTVSLYIGGQSVPDINTLYKIAEYFDVSADWLIGRPNSIRNIRPDAQIAGKYTGLNDAAIKWLKGKNSDNPYLMGMINRLFEIDGLADILFFSMYRYCISQFTTVTMRDSLFDTSEDKPLSESGKVLKFYAQEQYSSVLDALRLRYSDYVNGLVDEKIEMLKKSIEQSEKDIADMVQHSGESE